MKQPPASSTKPDRRRGPTWRAVGAVVVGLICAAVGPARAEPAANRLDLLPRAASSAPTITPIFGQLLVFSMPKDFAAVGDTTQDGQYIRQAVPTGQSRARWTEMITVTGEKDAATRPGVAPQKLVEGIAGFFRQRCPDAFSVASFGAFKVERHDGFAAVIACGTGDDADPRSQTLLVAAVLGDRDMYTLQWAERGTASKGPPTIDAARWQDRLARLAPVRLCAIVPGELPPFASCTQKR